MFSVDVISEYLLLGGLCSESWRPLGQGTWAESHAGPVKYAELVFAGIHRYTIREGDLADEQPRLSQEIADQRRGVTVGVVKVPVAVIERWEEMARELEGLPSRDNALETVPSTVDRTTPQASSTD